MKQGRFLFFVALFLSTSSQASTTRTIDVDALTSSNHSKNWSLPAVSDTLAGLAATQTLTNKTISGSSNTLTNLPVAATFAQEIPSGTVNGSNVTFTLVNTPAAVASVQLHMDGLLLIPTTDYSISGSTITMVVAPATGQKLQVVYSKT